MAAQQADLDLARGMQKLTRSSWPVNKVLKKPQALARAKAQLDAFKQAQAAGDESFLGRLKVKVGLAPAAPSLAEQIALLEKNVEALEKDTLDGELTPLAESEHWSVRAHFLHLELFLKGQLQREGTSEEIKASNKAADQALEIMGNQVWTAKWVAYSLKRRTEKGLEPYWPDFTVPDDVDPHVVMQLFGAYHAAFTLTEAELKKSPAPTT